MNVLDQVLSSGMLLATPIVFAAMGELISEWAGVINVELEAIMLIGAFTGVLGAQLSRSPTLGLLTAILGGLLVSGFQAAIAVGMGANQFVSGIALNLFAVGTTSFVVDAYFGGTLRASILGPIAIPLVGGIPVLGNVLFDQNVAVYALYALLIGGLWILPRTSWRLTLVACGESPASADALGVDVRRVRQAAVLCTGAFAGLGGGVFALSILGEFTDNMIQGRGFIALAAVMFGNWKLGGVVSGALLFGIADAVRLQAQGWGIVALPPEVMDMFPYLVTLVVLALIGGWSRAPSYIGIPYVRGEE